jgi:glycosyltransferase involved in cell wall biosynthesis
MQPYETAQVAAQLARKLRKPWIADLGDPWALDEMMVYPTGLHRRLELRRMRSLLASAAAVIMSTPEAADRLQTYPEFKGKRVLAIANGFEANDFVGGRLPRNDQKFKIVHTGSLHTELGLRQRQTRLGRRLLGGRVADVDHLTRSHYFLVRALNALIDDYPELREIVELELAGVISEADRAVTEECPVATVRGYVSHAESIALIRSADMLFLPMQNLPPATRATIVPGKTYEYLASETPILAAVPEGDARDLIAKAENSFVCWPDDVECMKSALLTQLERTRRGESRPGLPPAICDGYEAASEAGRLADMFDVVLGASNKEI